MPQLSHTAKPFDKVGSRFRPTRRAAPFFAMSGDFRLSRTHGTTFAKSLAPDGKSLPQNESNWAQLALITPQGPSVLPGCRG